MNLRILRVLKGFTQYEIAAHTGISQPKISLIERGFIKPKDQEKNALADVLKMDVHEIEWAEAIKTGKSKK
jgi:transcriptional regulator with XRE-family HTH domain